MCYNILKQKGVGMRKVSVVIVLLLIASIISGCGIAKSKYDTAVSQLVALQDKAGALTKQIESMSADYNKMVKDLSDLKAANAKLTKENAALKSEVEKLNKAVSQ